MTAMEHITRITAWSSFPAVSREALLTMLREKLQVLALQAFVIRHASAYQAVAMDLLMAMFHRSQSSVRSEINILIVQGLLNAEWNEDASLLLFEDTLPSRVDTLSLQLVEKVEELSEANERVKEELCGEKKEELKGNKGRRTVGVFGQRSNLIKNREGKGRTGK